MPDLYVMVALPRSGKSTYVTEHFGHLVKVSADQLRLLIYGQRFLAEREAEVWHVREIMLRALMEQQLDIVIDETNTTRKSRKPILKIAGQYGYRKKAIVIHTDIETCKRRAVETGQEDLIPVIVKMAEHFEEIAENEGFDEVQQVDLRSCLKKV
ncbi:AAA family ATPase [Paenibacillus tarimensis]